jgi:hypothetical protein
VKGVPHRGDALFPTFCAKRPEGRALDSSKDHVAELMRPGTELRRPSMKLLVQIAVAAGAMGLIALVQLPPVQQEASRRKASTARVAPVSARNLQQDSVQHPHDRRLRQSGYTDGMGPGRAPVPATEAKYQRDPEVSGNPTRERGSSSQ